MALKKFQILFVRPAASCRSVSSITEPTSLSVAPTNFAVAPLQLDVVVVAVLQNQPRSKM